MKKKLSELKMGESAIVVKFEKDDIFLKLMEMGFIEGEKVKLEKVATFGDPIAIKIAGYLVSLRLSEADKIIVEEIENF